MKRLSNKRRGLIYIRQKNKLRKGGELFVVFKISKEMFPDKEYLTSYIQGISNDMMKKYKMFLDLTIKHGTNNDDFIRDLITIKLIFTKNNI